MKSTKKILLILLLVAAHPNEQALAKNVAERVGERVRGMSGGMREKAASYSDTFFTSIVEQIGKSIVENINKFFFNGYLAPRVQRFFSRSVAPYAYDMSETVTWYRYKLDELILDPDTYVQVRGFVKNLKYADEHNKGLPRMVLYGAPGVGKTEIARRIVNEGRFVMKMLTGGELARMTADQIKHLMNFINRGHDGGRKIVLFIDEAETLFKEGFGRRTPQLQNFIAATGSRSQNFTVIAATNYAEQFDEAAFRRFDYKVRIRLPRDEQRLQVFRYYLKRYMEETPGIDFDWGLLEDEEFLQRLFDSSHGLSPSDLQQVAELAVAEAEMRQGEVTEERIVYRLEELQDKKNELVAQREVAQRLRREEARAAYFEDQMEKKFNPDAANDGEGEGSSGDGQKQPAKKEDAPA